MKRYAKWNENVSNIYREVIQKESFRGHLKKLKKKNK